MDAFEERCAALFQGLGECGKMVLSTACDNSVTSRTVSVIIHRRRFFFQTDRTSRKYGQLRENPNAALCVDNVQVEGICKDIGNPLEHSEFCESYRRHYPGSYAAYSSLKNERLLVLEPAFIKVWSYESGKPYEEIYDFPHGIYTKTEYIGE